jgi:nicotinamidase/pyrazinamidase
VPGRRGREQPHGPDGTSLLAHLQERGIRHLHVGGLATDYCVKASALDAIAAGLQVTVLGDAVAGVDPEASKRAIAEMRRKGADVVAGTEELAGRRE